jgi:hypothetical protein
MAGSTVPTAGTKPERPAGSVSTGILNVNGGGVIVPTVLNMHGRDVVFLTGVHNIRGQGSLLYVDTQPAWLGMSLLQEWRKAQ